LLGLNEVSVSAGIMDLYAPKFDLDKLGMPGEKVTIRVTASSKDGSKTMFLYGGYTVGRRHVQIASQDLLGIGNEIIVTKVERCTMRDFVEEVNGSLKKLPLEGLVQLIWTGGRVSLNVEGKTLPATARRVYTTGAKICAVIECAGRTLKIFCGNGGVEMFDLQRRKLMGLSMRDDALVLRRSFQNPEGGATTEV
jgi:hypothetical protein